MSAPIVFADTETTDIGPRRLAWELAMIRREPGGTRSEFQAYIEVDLSDANPFALGVGRFYDRHPLGRWLSAGPVSTVGLTAGPPLVDSARVERTTTPVTTGLYITQRQAALAWCRWSHGAHLVGAVPNFDTEVMGWASRAAGLTTGHHYHLADVENLITGWLRGRLKFDTWLESGDRARVEALSMPPWDSDALFAEIGVTIPDEERHTALGDARSVERAWDRLMGGGDRA
jgi:hypothetical protein